MLTHFERQRLVCRSPTIMIMPGSISFPVLRVKRYKIGWVIIQIMALRWL